jgi:hypothetical protein
VPGNCRAGAHFCPAPYVPESKARKPENRIIMPGNPFMFHYRVFAALHNVVPSQNWKLPGNFL